MTKKEKEKLQAVKAQAKKKAEELKAKKELKGERDEFGYRLNSKGHEVIKYLLKKGKIDWETFKNEKFVTPHHIYTFRELKKNNFLKENKDGSWTLYTNKKSKTV